ncbi:hypothetical protein SAMN06297229_1183 [Pseudidiomarina planktonica]|uniref:Chlorophyllase enzyme n=1 Tax=Pseudidiomarina planktonica TaxID=1323738 RepID=A0A1Y6ES10_9GAMM|nr:alpha/beta hydrolase [Pseudidiomarina planktonica]RUO65414.1 alpha/beta hydrolase [Pseudidiomarina planktonica]SMQ65106.1 hypothetical protein SAMN06297229_1183 [Pseudidiomarina planktonica]
MKLLTVFTAAFFSASSLAGTTIYDESRNRHIPIEVSYPSSQGQCSVDKKCPVALLSAGYGVSHTKYNFLSEQLNQLGYMVVAVRHELETDPPLSVSGDLYESRSENWIRGAETLDFVKHNLEALHNNYTFDDLLLIGHSNGGDISSWLANEGKDYIAAVITLDHRRVPLPRNKDISVLSIRGSDYPADKGVLPSSEETEQYNICVTEIPESRHNDMTDFGPTWLKDEIARILVEHIERGRCVSDLE